MREDLLHYYERELTYLRRTGAEFARRYPKVAGRLQLEADKCEDPHVERLLEGFAFLAARIHLKVDDEIPEVSESLLQVLFPHHVRPIPSLSIVQMLLDPDQGGGADGVPIARGAGLLSSPVGGVPCRFRTCYDTTLWPLAVEAVELKAPHELETPIRGNQAEMVLRVVLRCTGDATFGDLSLDTLRLHLRGGSGQAGTLLELFLNQARTLLLRDPDAPPGSEPLALDARRHIRPVGFGAEETLLPTPQRSLAPYALLQDYFAFPDKFHFVDVDGLRRMRDAEFGERAELLLLVPRVTDQDRLERLASALSPDSIRLGCTPVVNLFQKASEPILLNQRRHEYPLVADARRRDVTGIWSVDEVRAVRPGSGEPLRLRPFYSLDHPRGESDDDGIFWQQKRRFDEHRGDGRTEVSLSFVDLDSGFVHPDEDSVTARLTCFNEDLPSRLPFGDQASGDFEYSGGGGVDRVVALVKPTPPIQPPLGKAQLWRLISQLSLNYTSLVDGGGEGLRELLRLHNMAGSRAMELQIEGVRSVRGETCHSRISSDQGLAFARGQRIEIEFDEEGFAGGSVFLMALVLEHFLGRFVSLNSFTILSARSLQRADPIREWPPRSGSRVLL